MEIPESEPVPSGRLDPDEITSYERIQQIQAREARASGERKLRQWYAMAIISLLTLELIIVAVVIFFQGFDLIELDRWVTTTFIAGTLGQVSGMTYIVVRYLFPAEPAAPAET